MENLRNLRETGRRSPKAGDSCPKLVAEYMIVYHTKNEDALKHALPTARSVCRAVDGGIHSRNPEWTTNRYHVAR